MANFTYNGVNYTKAQDPSSANILDPGVFGGKLRIMYDTVSTGTTHLKSSDYIIVGGKLPTGSQVVSIYVNGSAAALTGSIIDIGDEGDDDRYAAAFSPTSSITRLALTAAGGIGYQITGVTDNYIRLTGATNQASITNATIKILIGYIVE